MTSFRLLTTSFSLALVALVAAVAAGGCGAASTTGGQPSTGSGGSGGATIAGGAGGTGDTGGDVTGAGGEIFFDAGQGSTGQGGGAPGCALETQFVYTLASDNTLYKFDPPTLTFTPIGKLDCPNALANPFSMAVDRNAQAWVVFSDGSLARVDTKNAHCTPTTFAPGQSGFTTFGMGFSSNAPGSAEETLFVSESSFGGTTIGLGRIDIPTLKLIPIGKYDKVNARAEMTGTGDARLFAAFEGTPYNVAEIQKSDAKVLSQAPQTAVSYPPGSSNFAFAFWGGDFWLFVGPGTKTDVFQYKPMTGVTTKVQSITAAIVGAGVSTCAPTKPPS
jgi:hypothetical protein